MNTNRKLRRLYSTLPVVIGVILVWRGAWVLIDRLDEIIFGKSSIILAIVSIIAGFALLYSHRHRADEEEHLL